MMDAPLLRAPEPVSVADPTPSLLEQAAEAGWPVGVFNFGKAEAAGTDYFNPSLVERPDGLWLLARRAVFEPGAPWGHNSIVAFKLNENKVPQFGRLLLFQGTEAKEQLEDPRAIYHRGRVWVGACSYLYLGPRWTGAHQTLGVFDGTWDCAMRYHPELGGNGPSLMTNSGHEKNWLWFFHDDRLHLLYNAHPWEVMAFGGRWDECVRHTGTAVTWDYGVIRGGTPPVRVGDLYWTFFHSSLPWVGAYRRYYMGALAFDARPPFAPVRCSRAPLLIGSQNDRWNPRKPPVVFPCGALLRDDTWLLSYGVNDLNCGWVEIPHSDVVERTPLIGVVDKPAVRPKVEQKRRIKRRKPRPQKTL